MIVVVDTNVWISALQFGSPTSATFRAIKRAYLVDQLATAPELYSEALRTLTSRFAWPESQARVTLDLFHRRANFHELTNTTHICRDPGDDMFLECSAVAGADVLVSGDKDLLALRRHGRTRIISPADYVVLP